MSSENGQNIKLTVFGESHASAVGVVIEGLPAGEAIDEEQIMQFMRRRMGGKAWSTPRKEEDRPEFLCGLLGGRTTGAALCAIIRNSNIRPADYENIKNIPRPSHADYPAFVKYGGANDRSGGGQFSGRLTAPLCVAGARCSLYCLLRRLTRKFQKDFRRRLCRILYSPPRRRQRANRSAYRSNRGRTKRATADETPRRGFCPRGD